MGISPEVTELAKRLLKEADEREENGLMFTTDPAELRILCNAIIALDGAAGVAAGDWHDLTSSNLRRCRFTPATAVLEVEFHSGATWSYRDVPADIAARLAIAESAGKFFAENIKGKFEGVKLGNGEDDHE